MDNAIASAGEIVDGALLVRAVEPDAGMATSPPASGNCLNCGAALLGPHCHLCGQAAHVHRSLIGFIHDAVHGVLHLEGKFWRTLPMLAWHPGELTRSYIAGRRASFVSPIACFLFATFLMFAVFGHMGPNLGAVTDVDVNGTHIVGLAANRAELARLQNVRAQLVTRHQPTDAIDGEIAGRQRGISVVEQLNDPAKPLAKSETARRVITGLSAIDNAIARVRANPQLAIFELEENAHKFTWLLIVLSVPVVWLLLAGKRRFGLFDHTIFVTYSLSFVMLLQAIGGLVPADAVGALALFIPVHMYRQLRGAYGLTRRGAAWRTPLLLCGALVVLILWSGIILALVLAD